MPAAVGHIMAVLVFGLILNEVFLSAYFSQYVRLTLFIIISQLSFFTNLPVSFFTGASNISNILE